jgi:hypothetical protein
MTERPFAGGTFNLLNGRSSKVVKSEVHRLWDTHGLDFLAVEEATEYRDVLSNLVGSTYFCDPDAPETGILVAHGLAVTDVKYGSFGDGWTTVRGGHRKPVAFPRLTVDGWLRIGAVHMPTPTVWGPGGLHAPPERLDDYMAIARKVRRFLDARRMTRAVMGDWNEPPMTMGPWSPGWIAAHTNSEIHCPPERAGHGRIDYVIGKRARITRVIKDTRIAEKSDHEPVIFRIAPERG